MSEDTTGTSERAYRRAEVRRRPTRKPSGGIAGQRAAIYATVAVLAVALILVAVEAIASTGKIHPGVSVGGVNVGGKSKSQADSILGSRLPANAVATPVTVTYKDKKWDVQAGQLGVTYDVDTLVDDAMNVGRDGGFAARLSQRVRAWFGGVQIAAVAEADPSKLDDVMSSIASAIDVPAKDASVEIDGEQVGVAPSKDGIALERSKLATEVLAAFASPTRTVAAPAVVAKPKVSDAAAEKAKTVVLKMIGEPAQITYGAKKWTLSTTDIAKMISFRTLETSGSAGVALDPLIAAEDASKTLAPKLGGGLGRPPRDARFKTSSGTVVIVPSQEGVGPDIEALSADLTKALKESSDGSRTVELTTRITEPSLTTEEARAMGVHERISTFTTTYDSGNAPRVNNIHLLGDALDGKLVPPGGTFSFNGAVGERTAAKGYKEANAIVKGKLVPQLGGGICQVGTTMFNAVFFSGFPVIQRSNHSFYISHYPKGRDATVSWGGPDLKWKNDTQNWVLVSVAYTSGSITISLYGTSPDYDVSYTTGPFTNETPYPTETVKDATLPVGSKVVQDKGETGKICVVTRTVTKGGAVVRTDTFRSVYKPKIEVVRVGTKPKASKTATTTP